MNTRASNIIRKAAHAIGTQGKLARKLGVSHTSVRQWIAGTARPLPCNLELLASIGVTREDFDIVEPRQTLPRTEVPERVWELLSTARPSVVARELGTGPKTIWKWRTKRTINERFRRRIIEWASLQ